MILLEIAWVSFFLWVLYGTSAGYEYIRLVPFAERLTRTRSYEKFKKNDPQLRYSDFMLSVYPSFFVRLFACPFCFGVWIVWGMCAVFENPHEIPVVYGGGVLGYSVFRKLMVWLSNG